MFFEYPKLLFLLIIPLLLVLRYLWIELKERRPHLRVSTAAPWKAGGRSVLEVIRHLPFALRTAALCLIIVAIARPRSSSEMEKIDTEGIDIILAMDVSTSMLAMDFKPNRLNAAKDIAVEFISQRPSDRMGIVVFAGESYTGVLFLNTKGDTQYRLDLYNKRGKEVGSIPFSMSYTDISIAGDKVYINNDQKLQIYTIAGRLVYDGTFGRTIRALIPGASLSDLLVVTAEEVDRVRLH